MTAHSTKNCIFQPQPMTIDNLPMRRQTHQRTRLQSQAAASSTDTTASAADADADA